ncbi:ClbS/DfsB family four-helix bundle protein [Listeria monocytogenes]|nr:ClbS/DfsB family four-helix bundle protein [Listeria monocytogenes]EGP8369350.1 ClbS/DfsB family four-helix bundle protein [Listeria monocytogenes]HAC2138970.1 ClbS/DfsB family four-helix bundle protein [Listeria monocytogenes]
MDLIFSHAYQLGWLNLLLEWEAKEKAGLEVNTPSDNYKWNNLGGLYQLFYEM